LGVHFYSEHEILHKRDVVAATELWYHDVAQSPHAHEFMEIVVVKTGGAVHRMRSGTSHISPGSVLVVRPGQWHAYDEPQDFRIWNLYIPTKTLAGELAALRSHPVLAAFTSGTVATARLPPSRPDLSRGTDNGTPALSSGSSIVDLMSIEPYLEQLAQPSPRAERSLTRLGLLLVVLDLLAPAFAFRKPGQSFPARHAAVIAATELLDAAPERPWTLAELAERVHTSGAYLCRLFSRELGISPLQYLERHRLELTAQLLLEGDLSISQISSYAGWSDTNYMARRFRAAHGMAPTRYRAEFQHRSKEMVYRLQQQGRSATKT
jgi:AraC family transcriptional regulator, L-rhamnose operon transcriptional activator RhaR